MIDALMFTLIIFGAIAFIGAMIAVSSAPEPDEEENEDESR